MSRQGLSSLVPLHAIAYGTVASVLGYIVCRSVENAWKHHQGTLLAIGLGVLAVAVLFLLWRLARRVHKGILRMHALAPSPLSRAYSAIGAELSPFGRWYREKLWPAVWSLARQPRSYL